MPTIAKVPLEPIANFLVLEKVLSYEKALAYQQKAILDNKSYSEYIILQQVVTEQGLAKILSQRLNLPFLDLNTLNLNELPLKIVDDKYLKIHRLLPLYTKNEYLVLATDNPLQQEVLQEIQFITALKIKLKVVETLKFNATLKIILKQQPSLDLNLSSEFPLTEFIDELIEKAIYKKASDIHFESDGREYRVRYRIDGLLETQRLISFSLANRLLTAIKVMAKLDISEKRQPQDGSFQRNKNDFRVSSCPTIVGEKLVIRLLKNDLTQLSIDNLGFDLREKELFLQAINRPQGLILVTGPTGSGKTTTLYTALQYLNTESRNIVAAEEPVEIIIPGINQVNIQAKSGLSFSNILKTFLRQDPDVIMIGEIRDQESAAIAIKASQTGHLVFSTLHTNNAVESITRLMNLGISPYDLSSSLNLIIAQRLVRKCCSCLNKSIGCQNCSNGYQGRLGLFEFLPINSKMSELINKTLNTESLYKEAQLLGMQDLYTAGLKKVKLELTDLAEINRVIAHEI